MSPPPLVAVGPELDAAERRRYGRQTVLPEVGEEGQRRLKAARVLLVGTGGLGSPLALYLAAAGVGTLGLVDADTVDASNLHRQLLFGERDLGRSKVEAAAERLRDVNPHVRVEAHPVRLDATNARELIAGYDLVADGSDNAPTRFVVNDTCVALGKPDVWGAVDRFAGQLGVAWAGHGACYRCLFSEPPPPGTVPSCAEAGVLGALPGIVGTLQATEVMKLLLGRGEPLLGRILVLDALASRCREVRLTPDPDCRACSPAARAAADRGDDRTDTDREEPMPFEIEVSELARWRAEGREHDLIDVRGEDEHALCHIAGDRLLPLGELARRVGELDRNRPTVVYCHVGGRSAQAAAWLRSQGFAAVSSLAGGIEAWSLEVDPTVPRY